MFVTDSGPWSIGLAVCWDSTARPGAVSRAAVRGSTTVPASGCAERPDHVWPYNFVHHRAHDGRAFRMLNIRDEFTRESLVIQVRRGLSSSDVIDVLTDLSILRGIPAWIRSDNGPEFVAGVVRNWIAEVGARTAFIERGSPWEND